MAYKVIFMETIKLLIYNPVVIISFLGLLIFSFFLPKKRNSWYGYRTTNSLKSQRNWDFAQKFSAKLSLVTISFLLAIQVLVYSVHGSSTPIDLTITFLWLLCMGIVIFITERKLKNLWSVKPFWATIKILCSMSKYLFFWCPSRKTLSYFNSSKAKLDSIGRC